MKVGFLLRLFVICLICLDSCFANPNNMLTKRGGLVLLLVTSMWGQCFTTCLYNYGQPFGDSRLVFSDDVAVQINLNPPFRFYGVDETAMWISSNGVITFDGPYTIYVPKHAIKDYRRKIIAVMHDDLFNNGHDAFYRQSTHSRDLELSTAFVRKLFPSQGSFTATRAIVLTWDRFKLYRVPAGVSPVLTLQTALISSNTISVVINLYIEVNYNQYPAIIGVNAGDGLNFKELCFSGTSNTVLIDDRAQQAHSTNGLYGFIVEKGQSTACVPSVPGLDVTPVELGHGTCVFDCDCIDSFAVCNGAGKCVCPADLVDSNTDAVLGGSCQCKSGFTGFLCDIDIDECLNDPCIATYSLGCQNLIGSFKCNCKPGYEGVNCQTDIDECERHPCNASNSVQCINSNGSYRCQCKQGFVGHHCDTDIDECLNDPCIAAYSLGCQNLIGSFKCNCKPGYEGVNCQTARDTSNTVYIDECERHPCNAGNSVQCINSYGSYRCQCKPGFIGDHCDTDIDECLRNPCNARQSVGCENLPGSFTCHCRLGYEGVRCQLDIDECGSHPCNTINTVQCINSIGSYRCLCESGFTGHHCDADIDECIRRPCNTINTLNCINSPGSYICQCKSGFTGHHCNTDIDECVTCNAIQTSASCDNWPGSFNCHCKPGYTGQYCSTDINECLNNSCQNGATCMDLVNGYKCICPDGFYGTLCDTNICRPLPADVVFVLDSSISMTESQFNKQLEFVSNFTDEIRLGPRDFQIAVITYSFEAHIEFYLNAYRDNVTMKEAIANITYKPGITNTHLALEKVQEIFAPGLGGDVQRYNNTMADRFVYLLTDGLSNKAQRTVQAATALKHSCGITVTAIGIGVQVSHAELYNVASPSVRAGKGVRQVYSVQNFNSLYTVLKDLVHFDCTECKRSKKSDVAVVMDVSYTMTDVQLALLQNALTSVIENVNLGENETNISFITFGSSIQIEFEFKQYTQLADILARLHTVSLSTGKPKVDIVRVLSYVKDNVLTAGRPDARSFIIIAGNGNYSVSDSIKYEELKSTFKKNGVYIIAIGSGSDVSMTDLERLSSDPFKVFVVTEDNRSSARLSAIQSNFVYSECDLQ